MKIPGQSKTRLVCLLAGMCLAFCFSGQNASAQQPFALNAATPELVGGPWLNTPGRAPISLGARKGKVTVVEFWTFGCINCRRNLPSYARWQKHFAGKGVAIIGIHTPETRGERAAEIVALRVKKLGITYPILIDSESKNWSRWANHYWPTVYLVDKKGRVRYRWEGELEYEKAGGEEIMASCIQKLIEEP